mgnify:FL=1
MNAVIYAYWLGLFMVGPFTTLPACEAAQRYQVTHGTREDVSECWAIADARPTTFTIAPSPTYGAPLTPAEYARRQVTNKGAE